MKSAEQILYEAIDELLVQQDSSLILPMTKLNDATVELAERNTKLIAKMQDKLLRTADKLSTKQLDATDGVLTRVQAGLDSWQHDVHFLLTQLATKGGFKKTEEPLEAALDKEMLEAPSLLYQGTLVLAVKEAVPYIMELVQVLREIRDRMPPQAIRIKGEEPAEDAPEDEPVAGTEEEETNEPDNPIDWPEV